MATIAPNTNSLWDSLWQGTASTEQDRRMLNKELSRVRWRRMHRRICQGLGGTAGLRAIEIGAGAGTYAALMALHGARVTVLDYSENALARSAEFFAHNGLNAEFVKADALRPPADLLEQFDVSMSFGLAEHFQGEDRIAIIEAHRALVRRGGLSFISVPNAHNPPYRLFKFIAERTGAWRVGEEYPFSRGEFKRICAKLGVTEYDFFGESLWRSVNFLNPIKAIVPKRKKTNREAPPNASSSKGETVEVAPLRLLRPERGTPLDALFSYALVVCMKKTA